MSNVIPLYFEDFRKVCDEMSKRIYYFQRDNIIDLYFISESMFVWSYVDLNTIDNPELFFGQKIFNGATQLMFKIPVADESRATIKALEKPMTIITDNIKVENISDLDIQKEGIEDSDYEQI